MTPRRNPSTIMGGVGKDLTACGLSGSAVVIIHHYYPAMPIEVAAAFTTVFAAIFGVARRVVEEIFARRGYADDTTLRDE